MKLEQSFEVAAPLERVWEALIDVERVAPCLPGAAVTGRNDDGSYNGTFKVKIGPTSASYAGKLHMEQVDESLHTATMQAQGTDKRGQGGAKATIVSSVAPAGDGATRVEVSTDYHITGRLARFGRGGMIEDISNRLLGEFAKCLQTSLAGAPAGDLAEEASAVAGVPVEAGAEAALAVNGATEPSGQAATEPPTPTEPATEGDPAAETAAGPVAEADDSAPANGGTTGLSGGGAPGGGAAGSGAAGAPQFTPVAESEPVQGLSLLGGALLRQARQNPAPLVALVLGFLLALRVLRHRS